MNKKIIGIILIMVFLVSSGVLLRPQKAEALIPVSVIKDIPRDLQQGFGPIPGLNSIVYVIAKMLLNTLTQSVVNWINSGFEGNPTFVQNPGQFLGDAANQASGVFIYQLRAEDLLCSPFRPQLMQAISYNLPSMEKFRCTFEDAKNNWEGFMNNFTNGGWNSWISITSQPQNNPYGAYLMAVDELGQRRAQARENAKTEASWGSGFNPLKKCVGGNTSQDYYCTYIACAGATSPAECRQQCMETSGTGLSTSQLCDLSGGQMMNTTPGNLIADQLTGALNKPTEGLNLVQDINQLLSVIFDALINQLINQGLKSLTESPPSSSSQGNAISESSRNLLTQEIDFSKQNETNYLGLRENSVTTANDGLSVINSCVNCYQNQMTVITSPNFNPAAGAIIPTINEINQKINDLNQKAINLQANISTFQNDINSSKDLTNQLGNLKTQAQIANTNQGLDNIRSQYYNIILKLHDPAIAQSDLNDVQQQSNEVKAELGQCQTKLAELQKYLK